MANSNKSYIFGGVVIGVLVAMVLAWVASQTSLGVQAQSLVDQERRVTRLELAIDEIRMRFVALEKGQSRILQWMQNHSTEETKP